MSERDEIESRLASWQAQKSWARIAPKGADIASVTYVGPIELVLTTEVEQRGVDYRVVAAPHRLLSAPELPDPWAYELPRPPPVAPDKATLALDVPAVGLDCSVCRAQGESRCDACNGAGTRTVTRQRQEHGHTHGHTETERCERCEGRGVVECVRCNRTGSVLGEPSVWACIESSVERRTVDDPNLPMELALDLAGTSAPGRLVHTSAAPRLDPTTLAPGFPDSALEVSRALLAEVRVPALARLNKQTLEVRRADVFEVRLASGATVHVWGDPVKVHPVAPLSTAIGKLFGR